ncbi:hypothetical protein LLO_1647 [Legionella longbeachae NSW150]|uniref:Uncharacterized protein n=1 Tax=Legionella longbeachae serogroup 1 (strain NSW150) TaxID=661367 RepID=D3HSY1_LEGLN|nr:hypothetical protein LLO_1647 [Legionella longbeachae NSW150]
MFPGKHVLKKKLLVTKESFQSLLKILYQCAIQAQHPAPQMRVYFVRISQEQVAVRRWWG